MAEEPETRELRIVQDHRERSEAEAADAALDPEEARQHAARADRAAYLREKLADRARSEEQV